ncbi:hypothetical protein D3C73_1268810 [compost metagenome]
MQRSANHGAKSDQQRDLAHWPFLRRLRRTAGAAAAMERLSSGPKSVCDLLLETRRAVYRQYHEHCGADRRPFQPQLGVVLHRANFTFDVDGRFSPQIYGENEPSAGPLGWDPRHAGGVCGRRVPQLSGAFAGV